MDLGIRSVNTAVPPLADSSSNPSVFNVARNARALGYNPLVDESVLEPVSEHFMTIARREGFPIGKPVEYDYVQYQHQVPGGMLSNLQHQLDKVRLGDRFPRALEESIQVRAEFGYPIMVTPLSQFVGSQAALNVIVGDRYKEVTDQVIRYALGRAGEEGARLMDANVKDKILDRPRAREIAAQEPEETPLSEMRARLGGDGVSDEELLLRWLLSEDEIARMRAAAPPQAYVSTTPPMVALVEKLARKSDLGHVRVTKGDVSVTLNRGD